MKVKSESEVAQLSPTLSDPMDCSLPGSSVHGILQARVLEWGAIATLPTWHFFFCIHLASIYFDSHFTDEETEVQRGKTPRPRPHRHYGKQLEVSQS